MEGVGVVRAVVGHFEDGAFADVEVAGEAGVVAVDPGLVDGGGPEGVVAGGDGVGVGEPGFRVDVVFRILGEAEDFPAAFGLLWPGGGGAAGGGRIDVTPPELGFVDFANHFREERGLRAGEEVGAVGVEEGAVVFDFEEEVFGHAAGEFEAVVREQAEDDEVAVPAVHFVEAAAGDDVFVGEVEEAGALEVALRAEVAELVDGFRQGLDFNAAVCVELLDGGRDGHAGGQVEDGRGGDLGVADGFALRHGAGKGVPGGADVVADGRWRGVRGGRGRRGLGGGGRQKDGFCGGGLRGEREGAEGEEQGGCADGVRGGWHAKAMVLGGEGFAIGISAARMPCGEDPARLQAGGGSPQRWEPYRQGGGEL